MNYHFFNCIVRHLPNYKLLSCKDGENGVALVFFAIAIFAILAGTGLALDSGNLYILRRHTSAAADAGAVVLTRLLKNGQKYAAAKSIAVDYAKSTFKLNGANEKIDINVSKNADTINVTASADADLWLMDKLFGFSGAVSGAATSAKVVSRQVAIGISTQSMYYQFYPATWPNKLLPGYPNTSPSSMVSHVNKPCANEF